MKPLLAFMSVLALATISAAQPLEREPIQRKLPDEELLQLLDELALPEIRAAYERLNRSTITAANRDTLTVLQGTLAELRAQAVAPEQHQQHAALIQQTQQQVRDVLAALLAESMPARERLELLALRSETSLTMLHGSEALLLIASAGMPTEAQRAEIVSLASEARRAAEEALLLVEEVLYELEDELTLRGDAVARQERRRLIEDWRGQRLPLLSALAGSAEALAGGDQAAAAEALANFDLLGDGDGLSPSARISLALAQLSAERSGQAHRGLATLLEAGASLSSMDRLAATFGLARALAESRRAGDGHAVLDELTRSPLLAAEAPALWPVLLADCRFRLDLTQARAFDSETSRAALLADAARHYQHLIDSAGDLGLTKEALENLVLSKLSACEDLEDIESELLPALALLARARASAQSAAPLAESLDALAAALARDRVDHDLAARLLEQTLLAHQDPVPAEPLLRGAELALRVAPAVSDGEARRRLLAVVESRLRQSESPSTHGAILEKRIEVVRAVIADVPPGRLIDWRTRLASLLIDAEQLDDAVQILTALDTGVYEGNLPVVEVVAELARARYRQWSLARSTPAERVSAQALLDAARHFQHAIAVYEDPSSRYSRIVLPPHYRQSALQYEISALTSLGQHEEALAALDSFEPSVMLREMQHIWRLRKRAELLSQLGRTGEAAAAVQELLTNFSSSAGQEVVAFMDQLASTTEIGVRPGGEREEAVPPGGIDILPLAREVVTWAGEHDVENLPAHRLRLARVLVVAGEAEESLALLDSLAGADETITRQARYLLTRADACFLLDQDAEAFQLYSTLIRALSAQGERNKYFWAATVRRLLILERQGRLDQIRPRLQRLRALDDTLGGDPYRRELQALERRVAGEGG